MSTEYRHRVRYSTVSTRSCIYYLYSTTSVIYHLSSITHQIIFISYTVRLCAQDTPLHLATASRHHSIHGDSITDDGWNNSRRAWTLLVESCGYRPQFITRNPTVGRRRIGNCGRWELGINQCQLSNPTPGRWKECGDILLFQTQTGTAADRRANPRVCVIVVIVIDRCVARRTN